MERDNPDVTQPVADPVDETLERLEVADTLEDLRHHIDDLIARLSEQEKATATPAPDRRISDDLEGHLETLGGKVESASYLLAELADLLEAQSERIETIEQQLGDGDVAIGQAHARAEGDVPRFTMKPHDESRPRPEPQTYPPQHEPKPLYAAAPPQADAEAAESIRLYLEPRFDRLENAIRDLDRRVDDMRMVADERERYVRELEERLLLLVEMAAGRPARDDEEDTVEIRTEGPRHAERRDAGETDVLPPLPPRPSRMPVFAHDAARARRQLVRRAGSISPPTVSRLRAERATRSEAEAAPVVFRMPDKRAESPVVASYFANGSRPVVLSAAPAPVSASCAFDRDDEPAFEMEAGAAGVATAAPMGVSSMHAAPGRYASVAADARAEERPALLRGNMANPMPAAAPEPVRSAAEHVHPAVPRGVQELERLVERDVALRRDFRSGPADTVRPAKAHPTVMVVDDAPDALTVLSIYLSKTGYQVVTATSAEDCLAKLRHHAIDAIVLDAKLSGASGEHVCRVLREDPAYAHRRDIPVIVYTGYPDEFPADVRDEWKADDYVVKGGDMLPLMRALVRHTSRETRA